MSNKYDNNLLTPLGEEALFILSEIAYVLQNMRRIKQLPPNQQNKIATQAKYIYAPISHRLGLGDIKSELEDLYLKFYATPIYHSINQLLGNTQEERLQFIGRFRKQIESVLKEKGIDFITKSRVKSISSIIEKMRRLETSLEEIYDVFAIRIILNASIEEEKAMCWQVHDILTERYQTLCKKFRDWLTQPRPSGYQALHVTLMDKELPWVEVQIRSKRMDEVAEKGSAAHWKYKEGDKSNALDVLNPPLARIRTFLEHQPQLIKEVFKATENQ